MKKILVLFGILLLISIFIFNFSGCENDKDKNDEMLTGAYYNAQDPIEYIEFNGTKNFIFYKADGTRQSGTYLIDARYDILSLNPPISIDYINSENVVLSSDRQSFETDDGVVYIKDNKTEELIE